MKLIDDEGNLFGAVNIIDALVLVLVVAVVVAGVAFVSGGGGEASNSEPEPEPVTVTMEVVGVQPYVTDALTVGPVETDGIVAIENKSVTATNVVVEDEGGNLYEREHPQKRTATLQVTLQPTTGEADLMFREKPLEIGQTYTLDFGDVTVEATLTDFANE